MESRVIMWSHSPERTGEGKLSFALESSAAAVCVAVGVFLVRVVVCLCARACVRARTRACTHTTGSSTFHLADVARWAWPNPLTITWHTGSEPCQGPVAAPAERDIKGRLAQFSAGKWPACLPNEETGLRQGTNLFKVTQRSVPRLGLILRLPMDQG